MSRQQRREASRRLEKTKQRREREKLQKKNNPNNFKNVITKVVRLPVKKG